ncbi:MAG TPA: TetR/AcrR family transcriptional regulator [Actinomycetes bacterium]|nr:TetR/AcrR family transcriptional regulator [Actinomycetes bacterium]
MADTAARRRTRRAQLDRRTIVDAALRLAATGTADAISFRKLGAELGVDPTAIYRHFRGRDELVEALIDELLVTVTAAAREGDWRRRLLALGVSTVAEMTAHPCVGVEVGTRSTQGPAERDAIEIVLAALDEAGLDEESAVRFYGVFTSYVVAFASAMAAGRLTASGTEEDYDNRWVGPLARIDPQRHPHVASYASELIRLTDAEVFETGLAVILDAAEAAGAARRAGPAS